MKTYIKKLIPYLATSIYGGYTPKTTFQGFVMFWCYIPLVLNYTLSVFFGLSIMYAINPKYLKNEMELMDFEERWFFSPRNFMAFANIGLWEFHSLVLIVNVAFSLLYSTFGRLLLKILGMGGHNSSYIFSLIIGIPFTIGVGVLIGKIRKRFIDEKGKSI